MPQGNAQLGIYFFIYINRFQLSQHRDAIFYLDAIDVVWNNSSLVWKVWRRFQQLSTFLANKRITQLISLCSVSNFVSRQLDLVADLGFSCWVSSRGISVELVAGKFFYFLFGSWSMFKNVFFMQETFWKSRVQIAMIFKTNQGH